MYPGKFQVVTYNIGFQFTLINFIIHVFNILIEMFYFIQSLPKM